MDYIILLVFIIGVYIRNITTNISVLNEFKLKNKNAEEYGKYNSIIFTALHTIFYLGAITEAYFRKTKVDNYTLIGIIIYFFALFILFYVIKLLNGFWTTKLIISEEHKLNKSFLFKYIKHPNYYLNIIPEFIGLALICKSIIIFCSIFPLVLIVIIIRIIIEEKMMRTRFNDY